MQILSDAACVCFLKSMSTSNKRPSSPSSLVDQPEQKRTCVRHDNRPRSLFVCFKEQVTAFGKHSSSIAKFVRDMESKQQSADEDADFSEILSDMIVEWIKVYIPDKRADTRHMLEATINRFTDWMLDTWSPSETHKHRAVEIYYDCNRHRSLKFDDNAWLIMQIYIALTEEV